MKFNDSLVGTGLIVFAAAILWNAWGFPSMPGDQVGPALFPQLIAAGLAICGAIFVIQAARRKAGTPWIELPDWIRARRQVAGFAVVTLGVSWLKPSSRKPVVSAIARCAWTRCPRWSPLALCIK